MKNTSFFEIKCRNRDPAGYHMGAPVAWLSPIPTEEEIIFPLNTFLRTIQREKNFVKNITTITVVPTFNIENTFHKEGGDGKSCLIM